MGIVVMLSGGVDSAALFAVHRDRPIVAACWVGYGQPAYTKEQCAARDVAARAGVPLHVVQLIGAPLGDMAAAPGATGPRVVPGRNAMLASHGVSLAASIGADEVWLGCIREDDADYPDCRPEFWRLFSSATEAAYGVRVAVPLVNVGKAGAVELAASLGLLDLTWSCYTPVQNAPCGTCNSCVSRERGIATRHRLGQVP